MTDVALLLPRASRARQPVLRGALRVERRLQRDRRLHLRTADRRDLAPSTVVTTAARTTVAVHRRVAHRARLDVVDPVRLSEASLRCPHASHAAAIAFASASMASCAGVATDPSPSSRRPATDTRSAAGCRAARRTRRRSSRPPAAPRRACRRRVREPLLCATDEAPCALRQGGSELFVLRRELLLAARRLGRPVGGDRLLAAVKELVSPVPDRGLRDALAASCLVDRQLTAQDGEHDPDLVLRRSRRGSCHRFSLSSGPTLTCLTNRILNRTLPLGAENR